MTFKEMVGERERVTTARRLKRDKVVKIARMSGCKNFVVEREVPLPGLQIYLWPCVTLTFGI